MLTTGTVTMSLAEIDALRDEIKKKEQLIQEEKTKYNELMQTLTEVKADKRVVLKTKNIIDVAGVTINVNSTAYRNLKALVEKSLINDNMGSYYTHRDYIDKALHEYISKSIETKHYPSLNNNETVEFVNFDDVKRQLRKEVETSVNEELVYLREQKNKSEQKILQLKDAHAEELVAEATASLKREQELRKKINELEEEHKEKIMQMQQDYEDLKTDKVRLSREQELQKTIGELQEQLDSYKHKTFVQRLLNI